MYSAWYYVVCPAKHIVMFVVEMCVLFVKQFLSERLTILINYFKSCQNIWSCDYS